MPHPIWPIIYVRGFAMTRGEIDDTASDPFCGFNLGSTVYRATTERKAPRKFIFESPVLRLAADYGYASVFDGGLDVVDDGFRKKCIPPASIVVYRYYDEASRLLGNAAPPDIRRFSTDLGALIARVRQLVCGAPNDIAPAAFKCYLVAHSMGGLVCRAFLQNPDTDPQLLKCVDKVFTYGTPHNGIDMAGINVPGWAAAGEAKNFNRKNMADYLHLGDHFKDPDKDRVDWLPQGPGKFSSERFFCMIGTNRADYEVAMGLSRTFSGNGSDGLVRIENASVWGIDAAGKKLDPCPTAYAYRSHSGYFGIVNSEEAYQNLVRFLFGDVRVDVWLDVDAVRLPREIAKELEEGRDINALYQFEVLAALRECRWYLTRRVAEEDSVACRSFKQLASPKAEDRSIYMSSIFMTSKAREDRDLKSLAYGVTIGVRVPDYEVERRLWTKEHFEGGYLYRDTVLMELMPPRHSGDEWNVVCTWQSKVGEGANGSRPLRPTPRPDKKLELSVPFEKPGNPGIAGKLRFVASAWN